MEFLLLFFPITIAVYFFLPHQSRNYWLLLASLFFYAWGEPSFVLMMIASILFNYFAALHIAEIKTTSRYRKLFLAFTLSINLGMLFIFKYMNFVTQILRELVPKSQNMIPQTSIVLPIGISFFTFQAMSYVIDVYRGVPAQRNIFYLGLYISFFPQLIAGPIVRYTTILEQLDHRDITFECFAEGIRRFIYGFNKKILLANLLAEVADVAFASGNLSVGMAWLGAIAYGLQIFFDFSGYSEMAIGLGLMFGFNFLENFNYPYLSKTITEFWRRWHISLGSWFRDYLYFPLGGSRVKTKRRLIFNLLIVWLATGIWHGANWTFLFWGLMHGTVIIFEKLLNVSEWITKEKIREVFYQGFTLIIIIISWVYFRAEDLNQAIYYTKAMLHLSGNGFGRSDTLLYFYVREYGVILVAGIICSTRLLPALKEKISSTGKNEAIVCNFIGCTVQFCLFVISISFLVMNAHNPFIYFNF